ncbi:MAG: AraC family transcriptional regulator [Prevotella sp.]|nr:AraC family transcriptional regulator [Prevotella sp.]
MNNHQLTNATVALAKQELEGGHYIDDDLVLYDRFEDLPLPKDPRRINCLFVALCLEGTAQYMVDTLEYQAQKNDVIIINAGHVTNNYTLSSDCRGIAIMCSNNFFQEIVMEIHEISSLFLFVQSHPMFHIKEETAQTFVEYFNLIQRKVKDSSHRFRKELVTVLLKSMLYDIGNEIYQLQLSTNNKQTRAEKIFYDFIQLLQEHFRYERRVNWYAGQLNITPKYLSESVKQVSKRPPNDWIDRYVIMEIRVLLKNSTMSIKEIAQELHFPNQSFLGKYFKEHVGMSPLKYRKG